MLKEWKKKRIAREGGIEGERKHKKCYREEGLGEKGDIQGPAVPCTLRGCQGVHERRRHRITT